MLSLTGNVLHHENQPCEDAAPVDFLTTDIEGGFVATFERKKIVIRDEYLNVCDMFRCSKETPTDGAFVYSSDTDNRRPRPCFFICCFESGLIGVRDMILWIEIN